MTLIVFRILELCKYLIFSVSRSTLRSKQTKLLTQCRLFYLSALAYKLLVIFVAVWRLHRSNLSPSLKPIKFLFHYFYGLVFDILLLIFHRNSLRLFEALLLQSRQAFDLWIILINHKTAYSHRCDVSFSSGFFGLSCVEHDLLCLIIHHGSTIDQTSSVAGDSGVASLK